MREQVHDIPVTFRANAAIVAKAEAKARAEGMSMSELMRHALRSVVREAA